MSTAFTDRGVVSLRHSCEMRVDEQRAPAPKHRLLPLTIQGSNAWRPVSSKHRSVGLGGWLKSWYRIPKSIETPFCFLLLFVGRKCLQLTSQAWRQSTSFGWMSKAMKTKVQPSTRQGSGRWNPKNHWFPHEEQPVFDVGGFPHLKKPPLVGELPEFGMSLAQSPKIGKLDDFVLESLSGNSVQTGNLSHCARQAVNARFVSLPMFILQASRLQPWNFPSRWKNVRSAYSCLRSQCGCGQCGQSRSALELPSLFDSRGWDCHGFFKSTT